MDDFEQLKITTVTVLLKLSGIVNNLPCVNISLPIVEIPECDKKKSYSKLAEIPHAPERAGGIVGCVFQEESIGIKRSRKKVFKNCVSMDMQSNVKNINIKLSKRKIHLVGASSHEDGIHSGMNLVKHLNYIQSILTMINNGTISQFKVAYTLLFFKNLIKGDKIKVHKVSEILKNKQCGLEIFITEVFNLHEIIKNFDIGEIPEHVSQELLKFFILKLGGIEYYETFLDYVDRIIATKEIISDSLTIIKSKLIMVNFNFKLNFIVNRVKLSLHMRRIGFFSQFDPTSSYSAAIYIPYFEDKGLENLESLPEEYYEEFMNDIEDDVDEENIMDPYKDDDVAISKPIKNKKKNKVKKITFLVYKEGSVTMSGPGGSIMKEAYNKFMEAVNSLRVWIQVKPEPNTQPAKVTRKNTKSSKLVDNNLVGSELVDSKLLDSSLVESSLVESSLIDSSFVNSNLTNNIKSELLQNTLVSVC